MALFDGRNRSYTYSEESQKPLYIEKEWHESVVFNFLDQDKIRKEGEKLDRVGTWNRLDADPLKIEIMSDSDVVALLNYYTYIYNQNFFGKPRIEDSTIPDQIDWNPQDVYALTKQITTVSLPFTFDCFNLERYRDNTYQKDTLDNDSVALSETPSTVPSILQGRENFEQTIQRYKEFFFLLPAMEGYCQENENLNEDHESSREVEDFLNNDLSSFFDIETFQPLLPSSYDPNAPTLSSVISYIENYDMENLKDRR